MLTNIILFLKGCFIYWSSFFFFYVYFNWQGKEEWKWVGGGGDHGITSLVGKELWGGGGGGGGGGGCCVKEWSGGARCEWVLEICMDSWP